MIYGYTRVSTDKQTLENQRHIPAPPRACAMAEPAAASTANTVFLMCKAFIVPLLSVVTRARPSQDGRLRPT